MKGHSGYFLLKQDGIYETVVRAFITGFQGQLPVMNVLIAFHVYKLDVLVVKICCI